MTALRLTGWLILLSLALAALSGLVLAVSYLPVPTLAHESVVDLESTGLVGAAARALHFLSSHGCLALTLLHAVIALVARLDPPAPQRSWTSGLLALVLLVGLAFSGRVLPWDQHGGLSLVIAEAFFRVGDLSPVAALLGKAALRLQRLWLLHLLGTGLLVLCLAFHVPFRRRLASWRRSGPPRRAALLALGLVSGVLALSLLVTAPLGQPFDGRAAVEASAEWYLRWLQVLSVRSNSLARLVLAGLVAFGLLTPRLDRSLGWRGVRATWLTILVALSVVTLLPVR